jgi:hypothetical protein
MAQKPDDWNTVSLCKPCHQSQHHVGERSFWQAAGIDPMELAEAFARASPKVAEISAKKAGRQ